MSELWHLLLQDTHLSWLDYIVGLIVAASITRLMVYLEHRSRRGRR